LIGSTLVAIFEFNAKNKKGDFQFGFLLDFFFSFFLQKLLQLQLNTTMALPSADELEQLPEIG
jgi:hypothetical protein